MSSNEYAGDIDPEIAELIGVDSEQSDDGQPGFSDLFGGASQSDDGEISPDDVDLSRESFAVITKFEDKPRPFFSDNEFYKKALNGEGEAAKRFHKSLSQFLNTEDPQERSVYRGRLIPAFWNVAESIAKRSYVDLPDPKRVTLRFGAILPKLISPEQRATLSKIVFENETGEPVHYVDEWLSKIAKGEIGASATDEVKVKKQDDGAQISAKLEKARGLRDVQFGLVTAKLNELDAVETQLQSTVAHVVSRESSPAYPNIKLGYGPEQRARLAELSASAKQAGLIDREIEKLYVQLGNATQNFEELQKQAQDAGISQNVDSSVIVDEFNTIRQMAKLCVGRQGNHLPVLMKQYFRANIRDIGTRENVITILAEIEAVDGSVFERTFKRQTNRIVPYVIIIPCYGDAGICWEPFEKFNRATSRGRVAVPMFPKELKLAVIMAVADLRWQVAKEKAQHYWMEEGLTGSYYQWFEGNKRRGDVRESFIQDYVLWITKESEGMQKLDKDVRGVFWRYIPFVQSIKDNLKNRGFVYSELYKRDQNREKSDGY